MPSNRRILGLQPHEDSIPLRVVSVRAQLLGELDKER